MRSVTCALASFAITALPAFADKLFPAASELWPNNYLQFFSEDERVVRVTLRRDMYTNDGEQLTIPLPRAWITYASGYDPLKLDKVPDTFETHHLGLALAGPTEQALSIRSRELSHNQGISWGEALKRLRNDEYRVFLSYVPTRVATEDLQYGSLIKRDRLIIKDSLEYDPSENTYLGNMKTDLFLTARCQVEANPITFCSYKARLGDNLVIEVSFLDFRLHAGKSYANDRMGRLTAAICQQVRPACYQNKTPNSVGRSP